jgi:CRISPR-associated Csx14 family protein
MSHILAATLGDSPIVVTSMFYLLTEQEKLTVDKVILFYPEEDNRNSSYFIIDDVLRGQCAVEEPYKLPFEDTNTEETCFAFLRYLFVLLDDCQKRGDTVYLSLAGGRKSMSAIMALVAPFYKCIKGLYHVQIGETLDPYKNLHDSTIRIERNS